MITKRSFRSVATLAVLCTSLLATAFAPSADAAARGKYDYLLAPTTKCRGQLATHASAAAETASMRCLINYARTRRGLRRVAATRTLDVSATRKAADILRCQQFAHTACGRAWDYWIGGRRHRFSGWGENIAWGSNNGGLSSPRAIMRGWLYSTPHRENLLNPRYNATGVGAVRGGFSGFAAGIWVNHFASR